MFHSLNPLRSIARFTLSQFLHLLLLLIINKNMKQRRSWTLVRFVISYSILSNGKVTTSQKVLGNLHPISRIRPRSFARFTLSIPANQVPSRPEFHRFARFARL